MKALISLFFEIHNYNNKESKEQILRRNIQQRLDKSLNTYINELDLKIEYLAGKDAIKILKNVNKLK